MPTGVHPVNVRIASNYGFNEIASDTEDRVVVVNGTTSPLGSGWDVASLQRLTLGVDDSALITDGDGSFVVFEPDAEVVLSDDFDADNGSLGRPTIATLANWDVVSPANPDLVGPGFFPHAGRGNVIDTIGSGPATHLVSKNLLAFSPGAYLLRFNMHQGGPDTDGLRIRIDTLFDETFSPAATLDPDDWLSVERTFTVSQSQNRDMHIESIPAEDDLTGVLVDRIVVRRLPTGAFTSPPGEFSTFAGDPVAGTFTRTFPDGTQIQFNSQGQHTSTEDRNGNTTAYSYDAQGRLERITDPVGKETTFTYLNREVVVEDPAGRKTRLLLDTRGDLTRVVFPDSSERVFGYDDRHLITAETSPRGFTTTHAYDHTGRLESVTLPDPVAFPKRLFSNAQSTGVVDPATGAGTPGMPAPLSRPSEAMSTFADAEGRTPVKFETAAFGAATSITDTAALTTSIQRDADGNPEQTTLPSGHVFDRTFDGLGNVLTVTDQALGGQTTFTYEPAFAQLASIKDARQKTTTLSYYVADNPPMGELKDELEEISSPVGRTTRFTYEPNDGLLATLTDVFGTVTQFQYTSPDRNLDSVTQGSNLAPQDQRVTSFTYTPEGYVDTVIDPEQRVTDFDYDEMGRVIKQTFPDLRSVTFGYNAAGNLKSITPPGRPAHIFVYDQRDREETYDPPSVPGVVEPATVFTYNQESQLELVTRPDGQTIDPAYESATGRLDTITIPRGAYDFAYEAATGLLDAVTAPGSEVLDFGYLPNSSLPNAMTWGGTVAGNVGWTYDTDGRIKDRSVNGVELDAAADDFQYDDDGLLVLAGDITLNRNATTGLIEETILGSVRTTVGYNDFGELDDDDAIVGMNSIYGNDYQLRDKLGRIRTKVETIHGTTTTLEYTYDAAGRLDTVQQDSALVRDYGYDANGNRIHIREDLGGPPIATYDDQDRLLTYQGTSYGYNDNGELETKTESGQPPTTYDYDVLGNLIQVDLPDDTVIAYVIDGANRRIGKKVCPAPCNGGTPTLVQGFLYGDQLNPVAELNGSNQVVNRFVYGSRPNVPDYMVKGSDTFRIISDHLGSVRLVVDGATAIVRERIDYDEFGKITLREEFDAAGMLLPSSTPPFQPFGFAGGLFDPATGLTRFGARDYEPVVGRWMAKDATRFNGGDGNLYSYAHGDPINLLDLEGNEAIAATAVIGSATLGVPVFFAAAAVGTTVLLTVCIAGGCEALVERVGLLLAESTESSEEDQESCDKSPNTDDSQEVRGRGREDRRFRDFEDALDQLEGVEDTRSRKLRRGDRSAPDFTDKSKQRAMDFIRKTFGRSRRGGER